MGSTYSNGTEGITCQIEHIDTHPNWSPKTSKCTVAMIHKVFVCIERNFLKPSTVCAVNSVVWYTNDVALIRMNCTINFTEHSSTMFRGPKAIDKICAVQLPTTASDAMKSTAVVSGFGVDRGTASAHIYGL
jgi:hypothetical protein